MLGAFCIMTASVALPLNGNTLSPQCKIHCSNRCGPFCKSVSNGRQFMWRVCPISHPPSAHMHTNTYGFHIENLAFSLNRCLDDVASYIAHVKSFIRFRCRIKCHSNMLLFATFVFPANSPPPPSALQCVQLFYQSYFNNCCISSSILGHNFNKSTLIVIKAENLMAKCSIYTFINV